MLKIKSLKKGFKNFWQDKKEPYRIPQNEIHNLCFGRSVEKRPIYCYKISRVERKILFVSAIHGNEIGTIKLAYFLLDYLNRNKNKYRKLGFYVIPCLNVDGFERASGIQGYFSGLVGRLNTRNVDLNRNFPAPNFRPSSYVLSKNNSTRAFKYSREISPNSSEAKSIKFSQNNKIKNCGEFGGSEPETRALIDLVENEKISFIFSFHSSGRDVMGGKDELSKELVKIYAKETGYEILDDSEWQKIGQTGTMKDWCDARGISFVEIEGPTRYGSDWKNQKPAAEAILEYLEGML